MEFIQKFCPQAIRNKIGEIYSFYRRSVALRTSAGLIDLNQFLAQHGAREEHRVEFRADQDDE